MNTKLVNYTIAVMLSMHVLFTASSTSAAEWRAEPSLSLIALYNDNVRMRIDEDNPESSTGYTVAPRIKLTAEEQLRWDLSLDARGKITEYQDIEDGDSNNLFFIFDGGHQTERVGWRLSASFERNSNFDTDFDTENPDSGLLLDDHTERKMSSLSPSVRWDISEISQLQFSLSSTDVSYDERTNQSYENYDYDIVQLNMFWLVAQNHQLGFTSSYSEYESPAADFFYDQTILQLDYTYTINAASNLGFSLGGRRLNSKRTNVVIGCVAEGGFEFASTNGVCPDVFFGIPVTSVRQNFSNDDDGTVINVSYSYDTEQTQHSFTAGRTVVPSSFGDAQEEVSATYQFSMNHTERLNTKLVFDVFETETLSNINSSNDRRRYRIEPIISYKLSKNWKIQFQYRYLEQNLTNRNTDSSSNAIFMNLFLYWPKLATTY